MRKHSVAISKRTHAPFDPTYVVTWRASPQHTHGHLLYQWVNLNSKMKRHTFSTEPTYLEFAYWHTLPECWMRQTSSFRVPSILQKPS